MINKDKEIVLFTTEPRDKTITGKKADIQSITLPVHTATTLLPARQLSEGRQAGSSFIYINTVDCPNPGGHTYQILGERIEITGKIDPVSLYRTMLMTDLAEKALIDTSTTSSLSTGITYAGILRYAPGTISRETDALIHGKKLKERPFIDAILRTGHYAEADLLNLVAQTPSQEALIQATEILKARGIKVDKQNRSDNRKRFLFITLPTRRGLPAD